MMFLVNATLFLTADKDQRNNDTTEIFPAMTHYDLPNMVELQPPTFKLYSTEVPHEVVLLPSSPPPASPGSRSSLGGGGLGEG
jgi:hypothetical protein